MENNSLTVDNIYDVYDQETPIIKVRSDTIHFVNTSKVGLNETKKHLSSVNLGECKHILKAHYLIPQDNPLSIINLDTCLNDNTTNYVYKVNYTVYAL